LRDYLNRPAQFLAIVVQFASIAVVVGGFGVYDAPEQWGPWTTAFYTVTWDLGPGESRLLHYWRTEVRYDITLQPSLSATSVIAAKD
jgi:hypothetical protein